MGGNSLPPATPEHELQRCEWMGVVRGEGGGKVCGQFCAVPCLETQSTAHPRSLKLWEAMQKEIPI